MSAPTSKLPTSTRPLILDPDLAAVLEKKLKPYSGERLALAQQAIREVRGSGLVGNFHQLVAAYETAVDKAVGKAD